MTCSPGKRAWGLQVTPKPPGKVTSAKVPQTLGTVWCPPQFLGLGRELDHIQFTILTFFSAYNCADSSFVIGPAELLSRKSRVSPTPHMHLCSRMLGVAMELTWPESADKATL